MIERNCPNTFNLNEPGTYLILFQVSITEAGQLVLTLNEEELAYTVAGGTEPVSAHLIIIKF